LRSVKPDEGTLFRGCAFSLTTTRCLEKSTTPQLCPIEWTIRRVNADTFDKYLAGFRERTRGAENWTNYSAYEIRIIGALVRLGRRREAVEFY